MLKHEAYSSRDSVELCDVSETASLEITCESNRNASIASVSLCVVDSVFNCVIKLKRYFILSYYGI